MRDVDQIVRLIQSVYPVVKVEQFKVHHPGADNDGIWFFEHPGSEFEVQIESSNGMCPFVIETDESDARFAAKSIEETVQTLIKLLHLETPSTERNVRAR